MYICNNLFPHYPDMLQKVERVMEEIGGSWIPWVSSHIYIHNLNLVFQIQYILFDATYMVQTLLILFVLVNANTVLVYFNISEYQMPTLISYSFLSYIKFHFPCYQIWNLNIIYLVKGISNKKKTFCFKICKTLYMIFYKGLSISCPYFTLFREYME